MKSLFRSYNDLVSQAYIIHLPNHPVSKEMSARCLESCQNVGQKVSLWEGFDGTGDEILVPDHIKNQGWYKWIKITDHKQSSAEIACSLSHMSLWVKCMEEDQPIVIFEHDAIALQPFNVHPNPNSIFYLGCKDQLINMQNGMTKQPMIYSSINHNWRFINRAHAYSIDPIAAKNLFSKVLERGIYESLDIMIKVEDVAVLQNGLYAYDEPGETTIKVRKTC